LRVDGPRGVTRSRADARQVVEVHGRPRGGGGLLVVVFVADDEAEIALESIDVGSGAGQKGRQVVIGARECGERDVDTKSEKCYSCSTYAKKITYAQAAPRQPVTTRTPDHGHPLPPGTCHGGRGHARPAGRSELFHRADPAAYSRREGARTARGAGPPL